MLLEREKLLSSLHDQAGLARQGRGSAVLVSGEAGIGKTSLLETFRGELLAFEKSLGASEQTARVRFAWGACDALFTPRPLGPLYDMAAELGASVQEKLDREVASSELLAAMLSELRDSQVASVLVFEDVHWADHATLDCIKFLGRRISMLPVLLILSYRSDEVVSAHPLTQVLGDLPAGHVQRLALEPLSLAAIESLVDSRTEKDALYSGNAVHAITGGNPFFVTEVLADSVNHIGSVPASIRDAVATRLARLEPALQDFLELLSAIPVAVTQPLLEAITDSSGEGHAKECVRRNLLLQDGTGALRFRHELARQATFSRLDIRSQQKVHKRVLAGLLTLKAAGELEAVDQLVHHAAGASDAGAVLEAVPAAARKASRVGSHREAAAHLSTGLDFVDAATPILEAELNEAWAYEAFLVLQTGDDVVAARQRAIALWRELNRAEKVGENLRWLSRLHWYRGEAELATRYADEAVALLESQPASAERAMAYSLRSQLHMLNDRMEEAIFWGQQALALAEEFSSIEAQVHSLNNIGTAMLFRNKPEGQALLERSLELALAHNRQEDAARVYTNLSEYAVEFRRFELAERTISAGIAFDTEHDLDSWTSYLVGRLAQLRLEQGRFRDAQTVARGVLALTDLTLLMRLPALTMLARVNVRLGEADALKLLAQALQDAMATGEVQNIVPVRMAYIESCWLVGAPEEAAEQFDYFVQLGDELLSNWVRGELVCWARRCDVALPKKMFTAQLPEPNRLEMAGDYVAAADAWEALGAPYAAALALLQIQPDPLSADVSAIHDVLTRAQDLLQPLEAQPALLIAEAKLKNLNAGPGISNRKARGPYAAARSHPLGLTAREQDVLALLATGMSNQEISDALSRSRRTVEHHVSSLLAKLNAATRVEAMLRVQNEPWLITSSDSVFSKGESG